MGVDLGRGYVGVAEQFLDDSEIGAAFQQMRCEAVPQGVRADGAGDAGFAGEATDQTPDVRAVEGAAGAGEEERET